MHAAADEPTAEERASFEAQNLKLIAARFRWGIPTGIIVALALGPAAWFSYPESRMGAVLPPLGAALLMTCAGLAARVRWVEERAMGLPVVVSYGVVFFAGIAAAHTGSYGSPYVLIMLLVWLFMAAFLPLSARQLALICLPIPFIFAAVLLAYGFDPVPSAVLAVILAGCHLYSHFGVVIRRRAALTSHVAQSRLALVRQNLTKLNHELEERVEAQVGEIVERAEEVEALNAQLRVDVRERARELAETLRRLDDKGGFDNLSSGAIVGGRVRLEERLGQGGMGAVFAAVDLATGQRVAVKVMAGRMASPAVVHRFLAEAEAAASVDHPVIVKTLAVDVDADGHPYQILELVEGISLRHIRGWRGKLTPGEVAAIGVALADALAAAHASGVIHRDMKPRNVLLQSAEPRVRLVDFGIAKQLGSVTQDANLTGTGQILGTPAYMAPEQVVPDGAITPAADIYGLGVMLYEMAAGVRPFAATGPALLLAQVTAAPTPIREHAPEVPASMAATLMRCLAKTPEERPTASELAAALSIQSGQRYPSLPPGSIPGSIPPPRLPGGHTTVAEGAKADETVQVKAKS